MKALPTGAAGAPSVQTDCDPSLPSPPSLQRIDTIVEGKEHSQPTAKRKRGRPQKRDVSVDTKKRGRGQPPTIRVTDENASLLPSKPGDAAEMMYYSQHSNCQRSLPPLDTASQGDVTRQSRRLSSLPVDIDIPLKGGSILDNAKNKPRGNGRQSTSFDDCASKFNPGHYARWRQRKRDRGEYKTLMLDDGAEYVRKINDGFADGRGKATWKNNTYMKDGISVYVRDWNAGQMEENGTMTLMKGSKKYGVYKGKFVAGKKEGRGTIKITTSKKLRQTAPKSRMVTYEGEWKADYCYGQGKITYIDGSVYEGNFVENRKVGKDKMQFTPTDEFLAEYDEDWKGDAGCSG